jgi:uncharacterized protein (DUF1800 family)
MQLDAPPDAAVAEPRSRRSFIFLGALAAAFAPRRAVAQAITPRRAKNVVPTGRFRTVAQLEVPPIPAAWRDNLTRLLRRASYATTAADLIVARKTGYQGWLSQQLKYSRIDDAAVNAAVAYQFPLLSQTVDQLYAATSSTVQGQLQQATLYRAAFSRRQLYERMVEFWSDHFNISMTKVGYLKVVDDRDVIRKHALGRFGDLLKASARSPAMLSYLDQTQSRAGRPNQNYARELMELHTLGVDGGYTQTDVAELSRVLTGWTITGKGLFSFDPAGHDWTQKTVLGVTIPAGNSTMGQEGIKEGEKMLDVLINHPNTAVFISRKMLKWLLTSEPTDTQVNIIAGVYRSTGGDIATMVRAILNDTWMAAAPARYKRPFHFLVSGVRALGASVVSTDPLNRQLASLGQPLFLWETPDGYPDSVEYWSGNITPRWSFASTLATYASSTTVSVNATPYMGAGVDAAIEMINQNIFAGEISPATKAALRTYAAVGTLTDARMRETLSLAIASSDFQWY